MSVKLVISKLFFLSFLFERDVPMTTTYAHNTAMLAGEDNLCNLVPRASYLLAVGIADPDYQKGKMPWERGCNLCTVMLRINARGVYHFFANLRGGGLFEGGV